MDLEQLRDLLLSKVRKVNPWGANEIVGDILSTFPHAEIAEYAAGPDEQIRSLIAETEKRMKPEAHSPGREFPTLSLSSQSKAFSKGKPRSRLAPGSKRNSAEERELKNGCGPGIATKSSATITLNMAPPGTHSPPSLPQRALDGEIVTGSPHVSDGLGGPSAYEHLQSSSTPDAGVPECSNATRYPPSSSQLTIDPCHYFTTPAFYDNGFQFSRGFGPLGRLEMDIRQFLQDEPLGVPIDHLPAYYFNRYSWSVQGEEWSLISLLKRLHTTRMLTDRLGYHWINLLENALAFKHLEHVISAGSGPRKIFIFCGAAEWSLTPNHVRAYFSQFGPVNDVRIPDRQPHTFGFVDFKYPDSVGLLLSEWHPEVPHHIFVGNGPLNFHEAKVFVTRCKDKAKLSSSGEEHVLKNGCDRGIATEKSSVIITPDMASPVTHSPPSQRALEGEVVTGSPGVSDGPDGPSANEHMQDNIALLPDDEECFYNPI